jgi:spore coat polysaccharide biosynthesis protein SpsF
VKTAAVIAARMGSSRFPGKTLAPILGRPMLERMVERIRFSRSVGEVIVATTTLAEDDAIVAWAERAGVAIFRGPADDVMERVRAAAEAFQVDRLVKLLGDNPLVHSDVIDEVAALFESAGPDYASNLTREHPADGDGRARFPIGVRVEVISRDAIERAARWTAQSGHREHVTNFIYEHPDRFRLAFLEARGRWAPLARGELTFAVNYRSNFELIERLFGRCYPAHPNFSLFDAIRAYDEHPEWHSLMGEPARSAPAR